jgi:hypothetical protein
MLAIDEATELESRMLSTSEKWGIAGAVAAIVAVLVAVVAWRFPVAAGSTSDSAPRVASDRSSSTTQGWDPRRATTVPDTPTSASSAVPSSSSALPQARRSMVLGTAAVAAPTRAGTVPGKVRNSTPTTTFLTDLPVVGAFLTGYSSLDDASFVGFRNGVITSGGTAFSHTVYHRQIFRNKEAYVDYNLGKKFSTLTFDALISDTGQPAASVRFEVQLDGAPVKNLDVVYGSPQHASVNVAGALRLRMYMVRLDTESEYAIQAGWGNAYAKR